MNDISEVGVDRGKGGRTAGRQTTWDQPETAVLLSRWEAAVAMATWGIENNSATTFWRIVSERCNISRHPVISNIHPQVPVFPSQPPTPLKCLICLCICGSALKLPIFSGLGPVCLVNIKLCYWLRPVRLINIKLCYWWVKKPKLTSLSHIKGFIYVNLLRPPTFLYWATHPFWLLMVSLVVMISVMVSIMVSNYWQIALCNYFPLLWKSEF